MKKMVRRALLAAIYLLGVALFFEGAARLALRSETFFRRAAGNDDASWRRHWLERRRTGRVIYYAFDVFHPTRGWALRPNLPEMPVFVGKTLSSNSRGLRGRAEVVVPKPPGRVRILVFGDSFTFGEEVGDDETYASVLAELLPGVDVLNFGVHGYGHDQMLLYLKEEAARYQPDVVLLGFVGDDMERNILAFRDYAKPRFRLEGERLVLTHTPVPSPEQTLAREPYRSKLFDLFTMLVAGYRWRTGRSQAEMQSLTLALVDEFQRTVEAMGARLGFAYLPVYGEIDKPDMAMTGRERLFFQHCRRRGIQSMYLRPFFLRKLRQGLPLKAWGHWSPLEHRTAAEGICAYLLDKKLLPAAYTAAVGASDRGASAGGPCGP